jgi:pimeloyl-ACP methyl ester carboxylesterase
MLTRRTFLEGLTAVQGTAWLERIRRPDASMSATPARMQSASSGEGPYPAEWLPAGVRSRLLANINGIALHVLEAGYETSGRPLLLLLHGYPELAYSWRKNLVPLAKAGYHVVAPDMRGVGRSGGTKVSYDDDLVPYSAMNRVRDMLALVSALGYRSAAAVIGHDAGSPTAGLCALARPDIFRSVTMMSAPYGGVPALPFNTANQPASSPAAPTRSVDDELAALPVPRKHYQTYYTTRPANEDMWHCPQGIHAFMRGYYHFKSADWKDNKPFPLTAYNAVELARLPRYYVMDLHKNMAQTAAEGMPSAAEIAACKWMTEDEMRVFSSEYGRTGFQGGLNNYRVGADPRTANETRIFAGKTIDVPAMFLAGTSDWGVRQRAGAFEALQTKVCTKMKAVHLIDGAGHWVQQEQADAVNGYLLDFVKKYGGRV